MRSELRLVVRINELFGNERRSCVGSNNLEYIAMVRSMIEAECLAIPVIERVCFGKCEQGPIMRVAPGGRFFTEINKASLRDIIGELKALAANPHRQS